LFTHLRDGKKKKTFEESRQFLQVFLKTGPNNFLKKLKTTQFWYIPMLRGYLALSVKAEGSGLGF
jgi:hypothetical protein